MALADCRTWVRGSGQSLSASSRGAIHMTPFTTAPSRDGFSFPSTMVVCTDALPGLSRRATTSLVAAKRWKGNMSRSPLMMQHGRQRPKSAVLISILSCNDAATSVDPVHGKQHWLRSPSCGADSPGRHRQPSRLLSRCTDQVDSIVLRLTADDAVASAAGWADSANPVMFRRLKGAP